MNDDSRSRVVPVVPPRPRARYDRVSSRHAVNCFEGGSSRHAVNYFKGDECGCNPHWACRSRSNHSPVERSIANLFRDSSKGAIESIESIVVAVNSFATMLSSMHGAIYSSFKAVIDTVDELGRLKKQTAAMWKAFALIRWLRYIWRLILRCLLLNYLSDENGDVVQIAWKEVGSNAASTTLRSISNQRDKSTKWLSLMLWSVVIGGSFVVYRYTSEMLANPMNSDESSWNDADYYNAEVLYDFKAENDRELSIQSGQTIRIAPRQYQPQVRGWLMAGSADGRKTGLVPMNYVRITSKASELLSPATNNDVNALFEKAYRADGFN